MHILLTATLLAGVPLGPSGATMARAEELPESAVSSPPMEMDDPGTPGSQGVEVNLVGTFLRAGQGRGSETLLDANYGIGDRIQLKFERPYLTQSFGRKQFQHGFGATEFGVKWRFTDHAGLQIATYPQYGCNDAFVTKDEEGNAEDKEGRSFYVPLLLSKSMGRANTLAANVGYRRNLENRGDDIDLALGAGRAFGRDARVLIEVFSERDEHFVNRQTDVRAGYVGTLLPTLWTKFELGGFVSLGHSIGSTEEGEPRTSFTFGVSFVKRPRGES